MDMKISGSGNIPAGEYESIKISGSGHMQGVVRCTSLGIAGSAHGDSVVCTGDIRISGSSHFGGNVTTKSMAVSGSANIGGDLEVSDEVRLSGGVRCGGSIKAGTLIVAGGLNVGYDAEAEIARIHGGICCPGLLNAENVEIETDGHNEIGSIGGSRIMITTRHSKNRKHRLPLFVKLSGKHSVVKVAQSIEGDDIAIENVTCPRVSGRVVAIGEDCEIGLLQYSERYEIHEKAKVGRIEKL